MTTRTTITEAEQARRAEAVRQIRHSTEMEGARSTDEARVDQDAYVRGEITIDELLARVKARDSRACHAPQTGVTLKPD